RLWRRDAMYMNAPKMMSSGKKTISCCMKARVFRVVQEIGPDGHPEGLAIDQCAIRPGGACAARRCPLRPGRRFPRQRGWPSARERGRGFDNRRAEQIFRTRLNSGGVPEESR